MINLFYWFINNLLTNKMNLIDSCEILSAIMLLYNSTYKYQCITKNDGTLAKSCDD